MNNLNLVNLIAMGTADIMKAVDNGDVTVQAAFDALDGRVTRRTLEHKAQLPSVVLARNKLAAQLGVTDMAMVSELLPKKKSALTHGDSSSVAKQFAADPARLARVCADSGVDVPQLIVELTKIATTKE